ncbi:MAG: hypothetical protein B7C24_00265 [Bacteroidetes bacterium 4572_77]|nr:MAG: hypothetical protein B7C24_00265 [Bacteroidetes bacterium 4572_77]
MKKNLLILMSLLFSFAFGQEEWRSMNTENSDIPSNTTISLGITAADDIYIGTPGGLVDPSHVYSFDQDVWTETEWISSFNTMKSSPQNHLVVATGEGLFHYANGEYSVFNMDNSNLTSNNITCMEMEVFGRFIIVVIPLCLLTMYRLFLLVKPEIYGFLLVTKA